VFTSEVVELFTGVKLIGKVKNEFSREKGTGIYLMLGSKNSFTEMFYQMADQRIKRFDIF
jgi:hypothetical protein